MDCTLFSFLYQREHRQKNTNRSLQHAPRRRPLQVSVILVQSKVIQSSSAEGGQMLCMSSLPGGFSELYIL